MSNKNKVPNLQLDKVYFIADIAANHDGDLNRAFKLIELAKESGADAAKFQHFQANKIVSDIGFKNLGRKLDHQANWNNSVYDVYKSASVPDHWTPLLAAKCSEVGIDFMSTPYHFEAVDLLDNFVSIFKIGSGDITWLEMIDYICKKNKPIFLATGAANAIEVLKAASIISAYGLPFCLMQCNTNYTGNRSNIAYSNLNVINSYKEWFPEAFVGLSDHTPGHTTVLGAVSLGARVIEKHFTDDNLRVGPDHIFSMNPRTWSEMILATRDLESALGDGIKKIENNEKDTVIVQRRSIRSNKKLSAGSIIRREDMELLRPCPVDALSSDKLDEVIGKKVKVNIEYGEYIKFEDII